MVVCDPLVPMLPFLRIDLKLGHGNKSEFVHIEKVLLGGRGEHLCSSGRNVQQCRGTSYLPH